MNKELKEVLNKDVSELDLVKAHLAFSYHKYSDFIINWSLMDSTIEELERIGVKAKVCSDYQGDYTRIEW